MPECVQLCGSLRAGQCLWCGNMECNIAARTADGPAIKSNRTKICLCTNHQKPIKLQLFALVVNYPSRQIMDSPAACATSRANAHCSRVQLLSHAGTLHPHRSATCWLYVTLRCPIPLHKKTFPIHHWGYPPPSGKKSSFGPPDPLHPKRHNWRTYTELLLLLVMYDKLART